MNRSMTNAHQESIVEAFKIAFNDIGYTENNYSISESADEDAIIHRDDQNGLYNIIIAFDGRFTFSFIPRKGINLPDVLSHHYPDSKDFDFKPIANKFFS